MLWAATVLNKYKVDSFGKTAYERVTGGQQRRPIDKFGEGIWWLPNGKRDPSLKAETMVNTGLFLGSRNQTNESLIAVEDGIVSARTIRRMPAEERWDKDIVVGIAASVASNCNMGNDPDGFAIPARIVSSGDQGETVNEKDQLVEFAASPAPAGDEGHPGPERGKLRVKHMVNFDEMMDVVGAFFPHRLFPPLLGVLRRWVLV